MGVGELYDLGVGAVARLVADGTVSSAEVVGAAIGRAEAVDPLVGALSAPLFERARRRAAVATGPFAGVPLVLKDAGQQLDGSPYWLGLASLRDAGHRSTRTTSLVTALERLGFVIVGKGAVPELAASVTTEPPGFPPARNPFDRDRTAGGSSGGSAAAVAAGIVPVAHGADATGSLRFPASACGLVTLKASAGRVPGTVVPAGADDPLHVHTDGFLCREAGDLTAVMCAVLVEVPVAPPTGWRVGVLTGDPALGVGPEAPCRAAVTAVAGTLEALGHHVEEAWPQRLDHLFHPVAAEMALLVDVGRSQQVRWLASRLGRRVRGGDAGPEVLEAARRGARHGPGRIAAALEAVAARVAPLVDWWDDYDLLVTPAMARAPWPVGEAVGPAHCGLTAAPFSLTGQPAYLTRGGCDEGGRPVGVQLVGAPGADLVLLALGEQLDEARPWTRPGALT